jgi:hypothetical protein
MANRIETDIGLNSQTNRDSNSDYIDNGGSYQTVLNSAGSSSQHNQQQSTPTQINDKIGKPRDVEILEYTDSSIKFSWMPPAASTAASSSAFKINNFLISYVDRVKIYRETNGSFVSYLKGISTSVKVPARGDPTIKIMWLVAGLAPNTEYDFNISAQLASEVQGTPVHKIIRTRPYRPARVDAPQILDVYTDNTVLVKTGNASERNGPILKYWLVVTPMGIDNTLLFTSKKVIIIIKILVSDFIPRSFDQFFNSAKVSFFNL